MLSYFIRPLQLPGFALRSSFTTSPEHIGAILARGNTSARVEQLRWADRYDNRTASS